MSEREMQGREGKEGEEKELGKWGVGERERAEGRRRRRDGRGQPV